MSLKAAKIGIVGAGNVGATLAYGLMLLRIGVTIVLFDRTLSKAEGEAWDIEDAIPLCADLDVVPTDRYADLADSDLIVVTVGAPTRAGEDRLEMLGRNAEIIRAVMQELDRVAPKAIVIIVSNPVDVLTRIAIEQSLRPEHLIIGAGTVLDTARLCYQLGKQFDVDRQDVRGYVIGEHGDSELIVWSSVTIGAIPLTAFLTPEITLESLKQGYADATRRRGYDILERKGHTSYGVATVVTQIVDAIWRDANKIFTVSVRPHPGYQLDRNVVLGLPCIIGKQGIERSLLLPLNAEEQKLLDRSALRLSNAYEKLVTS